MFILHGGFECERFEIEKSATTLFRGTWHGSGDLGEGNEGLTRRLEERCLTGQLEFQVVASKGGI
jgi:hypothetical protein